MTYQEIVLEGLALIGVGSLDPSDNATNVLKTGIETIDAPFAMRCLNGALQEIWRLGPAVLSEDQYADVLRAPATVTFTATQYSETIAAFATWASWMERCTARCSGDGNDNELVSATELLRPYMGSTGAVSATVYADTIRLPDTVANVMEPVELPNIWPLSAAATRDEFRYWNTPHRFGNMPHQVGANRYTTWQKSVAEPAVFLVEPRGSLASATLPIFMRLNPMPGQAYAITMRVKRKPPLLTIADIYTGNDYTDPAGIIPLEWHESVLLPFFLKRFTRHPSFANPVAAAEILEQYREAKLILESFAPAIVSQVGHYGP